jgi:hypothetical protein
MKKCKDPEKALEPSERFFLLSVIWEHEAMATHPHHPGSPFPVIARGEWTVNSLSFRGHANILGVGPRARTPFPLRIFFS